MNASPAEFLTTAKPQKAFAAAFAVFALTLAGCASGLGANTYDRAEIGVVNRVDEGTIVDARPITIEGSRQGKGVGAVAGAVIGGMVGHQFGGGRDERSIGAAVGAVGGAVAGNAIGARSTQHQGMAYTIRLHSGELITVTQGADVVIPNGAPVLIERGGERARVIPQTAS
jgi:outer membrane lipoprotein SlyB